MPRQSGAPHTTAGEHPVTRSDLLVSLVRAGAAGDRKEVATAVEAIIAEERAKQHNILADRLTRALRSNGSGGRTAHPARSLPHGFGITWRKPRPASVSKTSFCRMSANGPAGSSSRSSIGRACCARKAWSRAIGYSWSVLPAMERPPWPKPGPTPRARHHAAGRRVQHPAARHQRVDDAADPADAVRAVVICSPSASYCVWTSSRPIRNSRRQDS